MLVGEKVTTLKRIAFFSIGDCGPATSSATVAANETARQQSDANIIDGVRPMALHRGILNWRRAGSGGP